MTASSLQQEIKRSRQENILERLRKAPMTLSEIAEYAACSYHTARNDVNELMRGGYASPTGQMRDGAGTFQAGKARPMPMVYHKASNSNVPITALGESYSRNPGKTASSEAALEVGAIAAELMYLVGLSEAVGHPSHTPIKSQVQAVSRIRARLANVVVHLESITGVAQQMLKDERLWNVKMLEDVASDPLFNPEKAILAHETILSQHD